MNLYVSSFTNKCKVREFAPFSSSIELVGFGNLWIRTTYWAIRVLVSWKSIVAEDTDYIDIFSAMKGRSSNQKPIFSVPEKYQRCMIHAITISDDPSG